MLSSTQEPHTLKLRNVVINDLNTYPKTTKLMLYTYMTWTSMPHPHDKHRPKMRIICRPKKLCTPKETLYSQRNSVLPNKTASLFTRQSVMYAKTLFPLFTQKLQWSPKPELLSVQQTAELYPKPIVSKEQLNCGVTAPQTNIASHTTNSVPQHQHYYPQSKLCTPTPTLLLPQNQYQYCPDTNITVAPKPILILTQHQHYCCPKANINIAPTPTLLLPQSQY